MDTDYSSALHKKDTNFLDLNALITTRIISHRKRRHKDTMFKSMQKMFDGEAVIWILQGFTFIVLLNTVSCSWCDLDTGYTTITDGKGLPHSVFISITRDGGVWVRSGVDFMSDDWVYVDEHTHKYQSTMLTQQTMQMLPTLNITDACVQTDLELKIKMDAGWHPSYLKTYVPMSKEMQTMAFRHNKDCYMNTTVRISANKQGLTCDGGIRHACGLRSLPNKDYVTGTTFLRYLEFNPEGPDHYRCQQPKSLTSFTFHGSYYHVYVKVATCFRPTDSRMIGHDAKLRPHNDKDRNNVIIPDSSQTALANSVIIGWHVYAKVISFQHQVYLQVWRPNPLNKYQYTLIAQTMFNPSSLRFMEIALRPDDFIHVRRGDVLGLYYKMQNPLPYSTVPCASPDQHLKHIVGTPPRDLVVGKTYQFESVPSSEDACRLYSFTADLANKTDSKLIEDWQCPSPKSGSIDKESQVGSRTISGRNTDGKKKAPETATSKLPTNKKNQKPSDPADMVLPIHYILAIIGGLLLLMIIIGGISYYRAIRSEDLSEHGEDLECTP